MLAYPKTGVIITTIVVLFIFAAISFWNFAQYNSVQDLVNDSSNVSSGAVVALQVFSFIFGFFALIIAIYFIIWILTKYQKAKNTYEGKFDIKVAQNRAKDLQLESIKGTNNKLVQAYRDLLEKFNKKEENDDPLKSPDPLIKLQPKEGKIDTLIIDTGKKDPDTNKPIYTYEKVGNKNIAGVIVKPESDDKNKDNPDPTKRYKQVAFDIDTQKCYKFDTGDKKVEGVPSFFDPRNGASSIVPMENSNALVPSGNFPPWMSGGGGDWRSNAGNWNPNAGGCAPCGQGYDPRYTPCGQPIKANDCASISSRTLRIGNVNYSKD